jgi:hypothetical protein
MKHVTPSPSACQPVVRAHLAKVVGEVTRNSRSPDFESLEGLGCSIRERPKGLKARDMWKDYGTSGVQDSGRSHMWTVNMRSTPKCRRHQSDEVPKSSTSGMI